MVGLGPGARSSSPWSPVPSHPEKGVSPDTSVDQAEKGEGFRREKGGDCEGKKRGDASETTTHLVGGHSRGGGVCVCVCVCVRVMGEVFR